MGTIEEWKEIAGYEGLYKVSNMGRVLNSDNQILKYFDNGGYNRIALRDKNNVTQKHLVHRLVAMAFIDNPNNLKEVNHKDKNKRNNTVENLEWVTGSENVRHYIDNTPERMRYLRKSMSSIGKEYWHVGVEASKKPVAQIDKDTGDILNVFESAREASKETNSNYRNISQVCNKQKKTHNGFKWRFVSDLDI